MVGGAVPLEFIVAPATKIGASIARLQGPFVWVEGIAIKFIGPDHFPGLRMRWRGGTTEAQGYNKAANVSLYVT